MKRRLFTILSVLSLLLFVALCVLWARALCVLWARNYWMACAVSCSAADGLPLLFPHQLAVVGW